MSLGGPVLASQAAAETQISREARWSDVMTKANVSVARRESKMEHPAPQPKWGFSALGIPGLGMAAAKLLGSSSGSSGMQQTSVASTNSDNIGEKGKGNTVVTEGIERSDSLGFYDQDGFLRSSPDREARQRQRAKEREARILNGYVM